MLPKPPDGYQEEKHARPLLDRFVNGGKYEGLTGLPKRVDPKLADEFVEETLKKGGDLTDRQVSRCGELMRFYALRGRCAQLPDVLNRAERDVKHFMRSITALALLGDMGEPAQHNLITSYYAYLVGHRMGPSRYAQLLDLFFYMPENADEKVIIGPIQARMDALKPKINSDENAAVEYYYLEDLLNDRAESIRQARKRRFAILGTQDHERRRRDLGRSYLRFDRSPYVDLRMWAVTLLQMDCAEHDPPDLAAAFSNGFDLIMASATRKGMLQPGDEQDLAKYVTSCARAVEFYHGKLTQPQREYAEQNQSPEQNDVLYWEPEESKAATGQAPPANP